MQPEQPTQPQSPGWQYVADDQQSSEQLTNTSATSNVAYRWTASEFIAYQKNVGWYLLFFGAMFVLSGTVFLITRDLISTISIIVAGILLMVFAARKPRVLEYRIDRDGIHIGEKLYSYATLKSFAIINEGTLRSISVWPLKRFMPAISMYFEPQEEPKVVEALANYLPQEERKQDAIDRLMHRIRF